jgi:hypothetical protein
LHDIFPVLNLLKSYHAGALPSFENVAVMDKSYGEITEKSFEGL